MQEFFRSLLEYFKVTPLGYSLFFHRQVSVLARSKGGLNIAFRTLKDFGFENLPEKEKQALVADMISCTKKFHFSFGDYFRFHLGEKSDAERCEFVSDLDRGFYVSKLNKPKNEHIFNNKVLAAKTFADFYKRDFCLVASASDAGALQDFLLKRREVIVKPIASSSGRGIKRVGLANGNDADAAKLASEIVKEYCTVKCGGAIVEELIVQDERMGALHPKSVNTVRITSIRLDDRTVIFHPNLRVGRGDSVVDNAGAGGILAPVDPATGRVIAAGDKKGIFYKVHPETGAQLEGFEVPCWQDAVEVVRKLAQVVPSNRCVGWDLALSKSGWVLVEANSRGQWGGQFVLQQGFRREIETYLKELGIKSPFPYGAALLNQRV